VRLASEKTVTFTKINSKHKFWPEWWKGVKRHLENELKSKEVEYIFHKNNLEDKPFAKFLQDLENYSLEKALKDLQEESWLRSIDYYNFLPADKGPAISDSEVLEQFREGVATSPIIPSEIKREIKQVLKRLEIQKRANQDPFSNDLQAGSSAESPFVADLMYSPIDAPRGPRGQDFSWERLNLLPLTSWVCSAFRNLVEEMIYIGPLRSYPERYYVFTGNLSEQVGKSGEKLPDIVFQNPELLPRVNAELDRFGLGYELKVSVLRDKDPGLSNVFALRIVDKQTGVSASVRDVGFGVSQVLPIIVQSLLSQNKTLLIEQPEIHLHPALQAELGDLFIQSALREQGNTFILETHSEHLLLRIMRRMRNTVDGTLPVGLPPVRPEDVSVLYVQQKDSASVVRVLELDQEGQLLDPWPDGFFEEGFRERFS
jgi:hypothetical protein